MSATIAPGSARSRVFTGFWRRAGRHAAVLATGLFLLRPASALAGSVEIIPDSKCLECHSMKDLWKTNSSGKGILLFVDEAKFKHSVHQTNSCASCHSDLKADHPDDSLAAKPVNCAGCHLAMPNHTKAVEEYATSIHGSARSMGAKAPATCIDCHGKHDMLPVKDPLSPVYKLNLPQTCSSCHTNALLAKSAQMKFPEAASQYVDSMHGRALLQLGLIVAPSCNDCHGVHDIKPSTVESSPIHAKNVAKTCGACHVKVEQIYNQSIHGQLLAKGVQQVNGKRVPVCTDCHTAHQIEDPRGGHFKLTSDQKCGTCHEDRLAHYRETYHGKAMQLGKPNVAPDVAACYDCHGHHDVLPNADPKSHLSEANIVATCAKCHPGATPSFARYVPHASHMDKANYPQFYWTFFAMTALLLSVFTFFGGHTAFWLFRSAFLYLHDSKKFREAKIEAQKGGEWFTRFTPYERFLHILVVTSFLLLVITGMPLKFYYTDWAKVMFRFLGGTDVARSLHHFGAVITFLYFGLHLSGMGLRLWQRRADFRNPVTNRFSPRLVLKFFLGPDSMIPNWQDWKDFVAHQKWFFGRGEKPQFDRWTYWEKFDYFAVFWGVFAIGLSGLMLWFPLFFSKFMPGWAINIALIVHSDEALLAAGFIFTVHFFNTHFRLEKFPMDTVIFSGRVSKTELLHERKRWYERLVSTGRLEDHRIRDEWERWKSIARFFGYLFFGCGVLLLLLIVYAMVSRLLR